MNGGERAARVVLALIVLATVTAGCELVGIAEREIVPRPPERILTPAPTEVPAGVVPVEQPGEGWSAAEAMTERIARGDGQCVDRTDLFALAPTAAELTRYDSIHEQRHHTGGKGQAEGGDWVDDGRWLGNRQTALAAFGATAAIEDDEGTMWIEVVRAGVPEGLEVAHVTTPHGNSVWWTEDSVRAC